ncbi:MAG TPA: hydrogenase small subunit [Candidatus Dormibacteraeota bacterium]|nr:hydrogenase small subunit [Candidatus Dormibacteraeota bacterium]
MRTSSAVDGTLAGALRERGVSRRTFLRFSAAMAAALALPASYAPRIASAVAAAPRLPVVWLHGQACGGDSMAFLAASKPAPAELLLDLLSVEYDETLMIAAGSPASGGLAGLASRYPGGYLAVVDGAIPTALDGVHAVVGGRTFRDTVREVCAGALGTIAVGSCAFDGGASAAGGGRTGAAGVGQVVASPRYVALPGCPVNVEDLAATIVHFLTFGEFPPADWRGRPLSFYGNVIHNQCERRAHFEFGEFVTSWGDEGAQKGWCLYKMGCKGPETFGDCPTTQYAEKTSWPVRAGHGCIGCRMPGFWDAAGPAYRRLPPPIPALPSLSADMLGAGLVGGVGALTVVHGSASIVRSRLQARGRRRAAVEEARASSPSAVMTIPVPRQPDIPDGAAAVPDDPGASSSSESDPDLDEARR